MLVTHSGLGQSDVPNSEDFQIAVSMQSRRRKKQFRYGSWYTGLLGVWKNVSHTAPMQVKGNNDKNLLARSQSRR